MLHLHGQELYWSISSWCLRERSVVLSQQKGYIVLLGKYWSVPNKTSYLLRQIMLVAFEHLKWIFSILEWEHIEQSLRENLHLSA